MNTKHSVVMCLLLATLTFFPGVLMAQSKYVVTAQKVNVRSSASTNGAIVGSLSSGKVVNVNGIKNGWATISYKGKTCYVNANYLKRQGGDSSSKPANKSSQPRQPQNSNYSGGDKYEKLPGFAMSADLNMRYSNKLFTLGVGYDLGYQFNRVFYLGAGPLLEASMGDPGSSVGGGGYGKARFVIPVSNSAIKPMADLKVGYSYDFKAKSGNAFLYGGAGINIIGHLNAGLGVIASWYDETTRVKGSGSILSPNYVPAHNETSTKWDFTPTLFFSYDFGPVVGSSSGNSAPRPPRKKHVGLSRFLKSTYLEVETGYGLGLFKDEEYSEVDGVGNNFLLNVIWEKDASDAMTFGVGAGYRSVNVGDDSESDKFLAFFARGKYKFLEAGAKFRPFVALDMGVKTAVNAENGNSYGIEYGTNDGFFLYPQAGVEMDKFSLSAGYNRTSWFHDDESAGVGTLDLKIGYHF